MSERAITIEMFLGMRRSTMFVIQYLDSSALMLNLLNDWRRHCLILNLKLSTDSFTFQRSDTKRYHGSLLPFS